MYNLLHYIAWGKPAPKQRTPATLTMSSKEWKKWVAEMYESFPDDVAARAIEITAKHQQIR